MCGSSPLADAVTRSTGIGDLLDGSAERRYFILDLTDAVSASFEGPMFDPDDEEALYGDGDVADGLDHRYFGSSNGWPISADPAGFPSTMIRLPLASAVNIDCASHVTHIGYITPVRRVSTTNIRRAVLNCSRNIRLLFNAQDGTRQAAYLSA